MSKVPLTVDRLKASGFSEIGCWELTEKGTLVHGNDLPAKPGVYAFAIGGFVQYVGVASRSLKQRLNFYRTPGQSQRTNVRLNGLMCGELGVGRSISILVAHPDDGHWNGLPTSGAEGLEAGLIKAFELPWNMRGTDRVTEIPTNDGKVDTKMTVRQRILDQIRKRPGMTELELAKFVYGPKAQQPQANPHCRKLVEEGLVERRGGGGTTDPFLYYPRS